MVVVVVVVVVVGGGVVGKVSSRRKSFKASDLSNALGFLVQFP